HRGKPTGLGLASGIVAGLVAVTPASGFVSPVAALVIGITAGAVCYAAVCLKPSFKYDDSLDAFGVHGVGGFLGAVLPGVLAEAHYHEPKAAAVPPNGQRRFTVVVEGAANGDLMHTWSSLCQVGAQPAPNEFKTVYPYVTTVQGNRFRFRGGDPVMLRENLEKLFRDQLDGVAIRTHVES